MRRNIIILGCLLVLLVAFPAGAGDFDFHGWSWDCTGHLNESPWSSPDQCDSDHNTCGIYVVPGMQFGGGVTVGMNAIFDFPLGGFAEVYMSNGDRHGMKIDRGAYQFDVTNINATYFNNTYQGKTGMKIYWEGCGEANFRPNFYNHKQGKSATTIRPVYICPLSHAKHGSDAQCYTFATRPGSYVRGSFYGIGDERQAVWVSGVGDVIIEPGEFTFKNFTADGPAQLCVGNGGPFTWIFASDECVVATFEQVDNETGTRYVSPVFPIPIEVAIMPLTGSE